MTVDYLVGDSVFLALVGYQPGPAGADGNGQQQRGGIGQPAGSTQAPRGVRRRFATQRKTDARAQFRWRAVIGRRSADAVAEPFERGDFRTAIGAALNMAAERRSLRLGELAV